MDSPVTGPRRDDAGRLDPGPGASASPRETDSGGDTPVTRGILPEGPSRPDLAPLLRRRLMIVAGCSVAACIAAAAVGPLALSRINNLWDIVLPSTLGLYGGGALLNLGFLVLLWRSLLSEQALRWLDLVFFLANALVFVCVPAILFGTTTGGAQTTALIVLVRCIFIPDTPLRTLLFCLGLWAFFPLAYLVAADPPPEMPSLLSDPAYRWVEFIGGNFQIFLHLSIGLVAVQSFHGLRMRAFQAEQAGSYRLLEKLGEGGMGEVYRARHAFLQRPTAVKMIRADLVDSPTALRRFEREVRAVSELTDPNTVAIFDFGKTEGGRFYYAMEYLEGLDLQDLVDRYGPVAPARAVFILAQVLGSLGEAHSRGILHRDIKPGNLFLTARGSHFDFIKVLDFGLVKHIEADPGAEPDVTGEETVPGTPLYMAPERFYGDHEAGPASDLYSVGAVAYFILTGRPVFQGDAAQVMVDQAKTQPVPPSKLGIALSVPLERAVLHALDKDPKERFASAEFFREALRHTPEWGAWSRQQARRWWVEHLPEQSLSVSQPISPPAP